MYKIRNVATLSILAVALAGCGQLNQEEHVFTVDSKDRVCTSTGDSTSCGFEVYGTEGEVFTNQDDVIHGKWDSASFQAKFKVGSTYRVKTSGWRVPLLSMKPNIYEMELVTTPVGGQ